MSLREGGERQLGAYMSVTAWMQLTMQVMMLERWKKSRGFRRSFLDLGRRGGPGEWVNRALQQPRQARGCPLRRNDFSGAGSPVVLVDGDNVHDADGDVA